MFDALILRILSMAISVMLVSVPRSYESKLQKLPGIESRGEGFEPRGWSYRTVTSAGGTKHFYYHHPSTQDRARTILLIHGFNTNARALHNLDILSDNYELIAYNFPEHHEYYTGKMEDFAALLTDFCAALELDTLVLLGNSLGGAIAIRFAASSPALTIERLILVSAFVGGSTEWERSRNRIIAAKLGRYSDHKILYLADKFSAALSRLGTMGVAEDFPEDIVILKHPAWYRQVLSSVADYDGRGFARMISQPVLILHGSADRIVAAQAGVEIGTLIPHGRLEVMQDKGHAMIYNDAGLIVHRIRAWLTHGME